MKKVLMLMLSLAIIFVFTACGGGEESKESTGGNEPQATAASYMEILLSQHYYMEYTATVNMGGKDESIEAKIAVDGDKMSSESITSEVTSRVFTDAEKMYIIDDKNKTYMQMDASLDTQETSIAGEDMVVTNSGKETIDEIEYDYEEYADDTSTIIFYTKDGDLKYIKSVSEGEEVLMIVDKLTKDIPKGLLEIPSDYVSGTPSM